ncbi:uncharacterized protein CANTADRAFT_25682 [Suhomyces tanzawaensis NRRL Y-17324]|uniref:Metallo-dependent hydrolase n=1 Tax=Suhomyces tanzawaensis NRRL Y-17324 TaxID=984487 RepID=A0A1E4SK38_9ASCO|nr:uncharacterized protein CANTADRAFT_25682 [Suhomyces tanzawaensis NRRL Y-17324]ODV79864.1 hypothetical protein CANTADRAFT_25682 [Suhomyces tanzawaensis NRRL Y-17324]
MSTWKPRYFDIGVNFSDRMFQGYYNGSSVAKHPADVDRVIERAQLFHVDRMLITASTIQESQDHFALCSRYPGALTSTVGVHPCSVAREFYASDESGEPTDTLKPEVDTLLEQLKELTVEGHAQGHVQAFGEIGLDYDRLHYATQAQQQTMFRKQLEVIASLKHLGLPLFLHMRSACDDFISIIKPFMDQGLLGPGVVHSFTGTQDELEKLLALGFFIGVNGCSLKTEDNLKVAALIPPEKLMIETDAPWCEVRKSHASYKYITAYPNLFYPEIEPEPRTEETVQDLLELSLANGNAPKKAQKQKPAKSPIKLDEILPFPSIKKENFEKHEINAAKIRQEQKVPESSVAKVGELAYPLIKSRNEPVFVGYVAEIMCELYGYKTEEEKAKFVDLVYENTVKVFGRK